MILLEKATVADDDGIRRLLRNTEMSGDIRVRFLQEPRYFAGSSILGNPVDTLVARNRETGDVVGLASRAERNVYVNGHPAIVGYLSSLRIHGDYRNGSILARGFRSLRTLHRGGHASYYLTTIIEDNVAAMNVLTSGRAGLPTYRDAGTYMTFVFGKADRRFRAFSGIRIRSAAPDDLPAVFDFLGRVGSGRQFFPVYAASDFDNGLLRGMQASDVILAFDGKQVVGTIGLWDQRHYRQRTVTGYSPRLAALRPFWNGFACLTGRPTLPRPGDPLRLIFLAMLCVAGDDPDVFASLLSASLNACRRRSGIDGVVLGMHGKDALSAVASRWPHRMYKSRLYLVYWPDGKAAADAASGPVPYFEAGGL